MGSEICLQKDFYQKALSEDIINRIQGKSYKRGCGVPYEALRYLSVWHWCFDGECRQGEMIVHKAIAEDAVEIFRELFIQRYPIEQMVLVDEYDADDLRSMAANNSSAFNYRTVDGTEEISLHSYGLAIDINPRYNPYVRTIGGQIVVLPENGAPYVERTSNSPYCIHEQDACYQAFVKRGFHWGGHWKDSKDYQHFNKEPEQVALGFDLTKN